MGAIAPIFSKMILDGTVQVSTGGEDAWEKIPDLLDEWACV